MNRITIFSQGNMIYLTTLIIILFPLMSVYNIIGINLGIFTIIPLFVLSILNKKIISLQWPKYYWMYLIYMILTRIVYSNELEVTAMFSISFISYSIFLALACEYYDYKKGKRIYRFIVMLCSSIFFIQELMYLVYGYRIAAIIPVIPLNVIGYSTIEYISMLMYNSRSSSVFLEPSHFAEYLLPLLAIELFDNRSNNINRYTVTITLVLLLLKSGTGIVGLAIIWISKFIFIIRNYNIYKKLAFIYVVIPLIAILSIFYLNTDIGKSLIKRNAEFNQLDVKKSGYIRVIRGYQVFSEFPLSNKIFGMNSPEAINSYIDNAGLKYLFGSNDLLFSGLQSILIYSGILGLIIFAIHFVHLIRYNSTQGKIMTLTFITLSITSPIFLTATMLLCIVIIYSLKKENISNYYELLNRRTEN